MRMRDGRASTPAGSGCTAWAGGEGGAFSGKEKKKNKDDDAGILKRGPGCLWNQCSGPAGTRLPPMGRFWHCGAEQRRLGGQGGIRWYSELHPDPLSFVQILQLPWLGPKTQVCSHSIHVSKDFPSPQSHLFVCFCLFFS